MEPADIHQNKINSLQEALAGFKLSLGIDLSGVDDVTEDTIKNGHVQKFGYCTELSWKCIKSHLLLYEGVDENSPKANIKAFYRNQEMPVDLYEGLIKMIDDRNTMSHVYNLDKFEELHERLPQHLVRMEEVLRLLQEGAKKR